MDATAPTARSEAPSIRAGGRRALAAAALLGLAALGACARRGPGEGRREEAVVVFAAASLRDAFGAIAGELERAHPGVEVTFNFAGTQELRTQLEHGAPADVFASADVRHMRELVRAGRVATPATFARNEPVLVVARESAGTIRGLADLPAADRIVVAAPEVPIGGYTLQILERAAARMGSDFRARFESKVVSRELNVRQVLAKVSLGEAQAGIVYRTDVAAAKGAVSVLPIPPDVNVTAEYPIAVVNGAAHPRLARAFVELVRSPLGREALQRVGFLPPPPADGPAP
jgi:molybdate transport system substrate-binding protein